MRLIKDAHEIALMRRAGEISSRRTRARCAASRPGQHEYQVEAELLHEFLPQRRAGAGLSADRRRRRRTPACCTIATTTRQLHDGDLLLIDAGCEIDGYASDITRTFPVNGRFTGPQKAMYELVLAAQLAAIDAVRPGAPVQRATTRPRSACWRRACIDLGPLQGHARRRDRAEGATSSSTCTAPATGSASTCTTPATTARRSSGQWQTLQPGMVLTVEPGIYIRPADNVPEQFWNIGVRIEDDMLVTAGGNDNLTALTPKSVADVEHACRR